MVYNQDGVQRSVKTKKKKLYYLLVPLVPHIAL